MLKIKVNIDKVYCLAERQQRTARLATAIWRLPQIDTRRPSS
jgi:hypothetical protein